MNRKQTAKILSLVAVVALLLTFGMMLGITAAATETPDVIDSEAELVTALEAGGTVTVGGNITLTQSVAITKDVTLQSAETGPFTITRGNFDASMFVVNGGTFTLTNITLDGASTASTVNGGAINIETDGSLVVNQGTTIQNFKAADGGAVYNLGTLKINDGLFAGNTAKATTWRDASANWDNTVYTYTPANGYGGSIYTKGTFSMTGGTVLGSTAFYGGGAYIADGSVAVTISGGTWSGNKALAEQRPDADPNYKQTAEGASSVINTTVTGGAIWTGADITISGTTVISDNKAVNGGGLYVNSKKLSVLGGTIGCSEHATEGHTCKKNDATLGGGVYMNYGTFAMSGGKIIGNNATKGGAVYLFQLTATNPFNLTGGEILNNSATDGGAFYYNTDWQSNNEVYKISGGTIKGNSATNNGGALFLADEQWKFKYTFEISDSAVICNNIAGVSGGAIYCRNGGGISVIGGTIGCANHTSEDHTCGANVANTSGGAIYCATFLNISGGKIVGNNAGNGGGIYYDADQSLTITGGEISYNNALRGAGVYITDDKIVMTGGSISGNICTAGQAFGGGIYGNDAASEVWVLGGTISENVAHHSGGGIATKGSLYVLGGSIEDNSIERGGNWNNIAGTAIVAHKIYLLGGTITGNTRTGDLASNGYSGSITMLGEDGGIYLGSTMTVTSAPEGVGESQGESSVLLTASEPLKIFGNDNVTLKVSDVMMPGCNISQFYAASLWASAGLTTSYNITIVSDLMEGSKVVFCDNFDAEANNYFAKLDAAYTNVSAGTLSAIQLLGADAAYNATVSDGKLTWPTDAYQYITSYAVLDQEITFSVCIAARNSGLVVKWNDGEISGKHEARAEGTGTWYDIPMSPKHLTKAVNIGGTETKLSLKAYLDAITSGSDYTETQKNLAQAVLYYGSAAQDVFGKEGEELAVSDYATKLLSDEAFKTALEGYTLVINNSTTENAPVFSSAQVFIDSTIKLQITVQNLGTANTVTMDETEVVSGKSGTVTFEVALTAGQLYAVPTFAIDEVSTLEYGLYTFLARTYGKDETKNNLFKAVYHYAEMVKAYTTPSESN